VTDTNKDADIRHFSVEKRLAETFFRDFFRQAWEVIEPSTAFVPNWHIDVECDHAQAVTEGKIHNLIVNQPPRTLKSTIWAVAWPAWEWGPAGHPETRWVFSSYASNLAVRDSVACRRLIESPWYQRRWGDRFQLSGDQNVKSHFENTKAGRRFSTSIDSRTTGWGGARVVIDDPNGANEGNAVRKFANDWWDQTMSSRLDDRRTGTRVVIQQRIHEDDLSGHLLNKGGYEHLCIRMEWEGPQKATILGWRDPRTKRGELLYPGENPRIGPVQVAELKRDLGAYAYSGQYQQRPSPAEGGILKRYWFKYWNYPGQPLPPITVRNKKGEYEEVASGPLPIFDEEALSIDCSFKALDTSDFVAAGHWARRGADKYLLNQRCERMTFTETVACVESMTLNAPRATLKLIEDKANGTAVIDTLKSKITGIVPVNPQGGKMARAQAISPQVEAGNVYLPHPLIAPWVDAFLDECAAFPNASHDDQVDQMTQVLLRWQTHSGIFHTSEQAVVCQPINIPASWKRGASMIIRGDKVSSIWAATDPASGVIYLTMEYVRSGVDPMVHASALMAAGRWMPFTVSIADLSEADGRKVAQRYRALGIRAMDATGEPEAFLQELTQAMGAGRFKCFSQLSQWVEQFRLAGNRPDKAIDITGDLIAATCLLYGARERMQIGQASVGAKAEGNSMTPSASSGRIGINWG
jgi:predicted phage terminase large subunit-like protein